MAQDHVLAAPVEPQGSDLKIPSLPVGATFLSVGGLAAAFGAASCCALPLILGGLGFGTAWLGVIALIAAPFRTGLLIFALAGLMAAGFLLWRRRVIARGCAVGRSQRGTVPATVSIVSIALGSMLVVLGVWFA